MSTTTIEWTEVTWNPTTGCDRITAGCDNCYALTMARRLKAMGSEKYQRDGDPKTSGPGFGITEHPDVLAAPLHWRKPRKVFVNSTSDLFHKGVSDEFIARVFAVMALTPQHTFQLLTKRHGRLRSLLAGASDNGFHESMSAEMDRRSKVGGIVQWPLPNVHVGVSVEDQKAAELRIGALLDTPAAVRWLSCEPLIGPVDLYGLADEHGHRRRLTYWTTGRPGWGPANTHPSGIVTHPLEVGPRLDWVVCGGESGPGARRMDPAWARQLRDQCAASGVPFFFKQTGSVLAKEWGCASGKGGDPAEWPESFPREFPRGH